MTASMCTKCERATETRDKTGRFGRFLHARCFDKWWRSEYGELRGPYYRWMRQGMCVR